MPSKQSDYRASEGTPDSTFSQINLTGFKSQLAPYISRYIHYISYIPHSKRKNTQFQYKYTTHDENQPCSIKRYLRCG